jgi:tetratricopeptide (TPR) repeat protein
MLLILTRMPDGASLGRSPCRSEKLAVRLLLLRRNGEVEHKRSSRLLVRFLLALCAFAAPAGADELLWKVLSLRQGGNPDVAFVEVALTAASTSAAQPFRLNRNASISLASGSAIAVPPRTVIELATPSGTKVTLEPNTVFHAVTVTTNGEAYSVCKGRVTFVVSKVLDFFSVSCEHILAAVRGTVFTVEAVERSHISFEVFEGKVEVSRETKLRVADDAEPLPGIVASELLSKENKSRATYRFAYDELLGGGFKSYEDARRHFAAQLERDADSYDVQQRNLFALGLILQRLRESSQAIPYYERALKAAQTKGDRQRAAWALNNLGAAYQDLEDYCRAANYHERALAVRREIYPEVHREIADSFNNLGIVRKGLRDFDNALKYHQRALAIRERLSVNALLVAVSYSNLGTTYAAMGDFSRAARYHERALEIRQGAYGLRLHPSCAISYQNLAEDYLQLVELMKAKRYATWAIEAFEKLGLANHPYAALSYDTLGATLRREKTFDRAAAAHQRALDIRVAASANVPRRELATSRLNFGRLHRDQGRTVLALQDYQRAIDTLADSAEAQRDPIAADAYSELAALLTTLGRTEEANTSSQKAAQVSAAARAPRSCSQDDAPLQ